MEMKLGTYAYYIISMTTTCFYDDHTLFEETSDDYLYNSILCNKSIHLALRKFDYFLRNTVRKLTNQIM